MLVAQQVPHHFSGDLELGVGHAGNGSRRLVACRWTLTVPVWVDAMRTDGVLAIRFLLLSSSLLAGPGSDVGQVAVRCTAARAAESPLPQPVTAQRAPRWRGARRFLLLSTI